MLSYSHTLKIMFLCEICILYLSAASFLYPLFLSDILLSLSVKDRRQYYRTSNSVPLDDIKVWTPTAGQTPNNSHHYCHRHSGTGGSGGEIFQEAGVQRHEHSFQCYQIFGHIATKCTIRAMWHISELFVKQKHL